MLFSIGNAGRIFAAAFALCATTSCASLPLDDTTADQWPVVDQAVRLQAIVLDDPKFSAVLRDLEARGAITWTDTLIPSAQAQARTHSTPVDWLVARYREAGGFQRADIRLWRKLNPWSSTTASTAAGSPRTRLNIWRLNRPADSVAATLIHERVHSFGQVHAHGQTKPPNRCDAANIAGDLTESILHRGDGGTLYGDNVCPALCEALDRADLPKPNTCASDPR